MHAHLFPVYVIFILRMYGAILSFKVFLRVLDIKREGH